MRKCNTILSRVIIILVLLHAFMGSMTLLGISTVSFWQLSWLLLLAVLLHAVFGIVSTIPTIRSAKRGGRWYLRENAVFWIKRLSGIVVLILTVFHLSAYNASVNGVFFRREFTTCYMVSQLVFVMAIFVHLTVSLKSMLIAKGVISWKERRMDWMLVLSAFLLLFAVAIVVYYIRWQW